MGFKCPGGYFDAKAKDAHDGVMVILSLDYGDRYVGAAITDPEGRIALRHMVIDQKGEEGLGRVMAMIKKEGVEKVIIGVPKGMAGVETEQTKKTITFIEKLRENIGEGTKVEEVNEVFTSKEARRLLQSEGGNLDDEHMEAARIMLEDYLRNPNFKIQNPK